MIDYTSLLKINAESVIAAFEKENEGKSIEEKKASAKSYIEMIDKQAGMVYAAKGFTQNIDFSQFSDTNDEYSRRLNALLKDSHNAMHKVINEITVKLKSYFEQVINS